MKAATPAPSHAIGETAGVFEADGAPRVGRRHELGRRSQVHHRRGEVG